jgi:hypothetical protein
VGLDTIVRRVLTYLDHFGNLSLLGRNATFEYLHLHEIMRRGKDLVEALRAAAGGQASPCASSL